MSNKLHKLQKHESCTSRKSYVFTKMMARDNLDVLQNIEFMLVRGSLLDPGVDDCVVLDALNGSLKGEPPQEKRALTLFNMLRSIRALRQNLAEEIWQDGLKAVSISVRRNSTLQPGAKGYLDFVSKFVGYSR